jgi:hypothetical protein
MLQMSFSALLFYGYIGIIGLGLWGFLRWFKSEIKLATVWCVYGTTHWHVHQGTVLHK